MRTPRFRKAIAAALGTAVALTLVACTPSTEADDSTDANPTVVFGWLKSTADLAAYHAETVAEDEPIELQSELFKTAVDVQTALNSNQINIGMLTPVHLLRGIEQGQDLLQISGNTRGNSGIMLSSELGIENGDWDALKELLEERKLKIAASRGSINEALAIATFEHHGIDVEKSIELINVTDFSQHGEGIRLGEFDGAFTMETFATLMQVGGYAELFATPYDTEAGDINTIFVANGTWAEENPEAVQAFVDTIAKASNALASDDELNIEVGMELMGIDRETAEMALANNRYELGLGVEETKVFAKLFFELGHLERDLTDEVDDYVDESFVQAATK
ncbi:MAG: ABC transporter substrate-binding protein [Salinibacterium sp.]|nr:ABC transporter substrate-binding protein [Salinibacterium sp.]MBF0672741.1 ABC transporter substrate-binding protein [Salinibacterium sp.]